MSNQINAKAFTHQNDIYFNQGQYNPTSSSGKHLLAHELTHTIQQGAAVQRKPQISTNAQPSIQRGLADMINDVARQVPGYTLFTVIIGHNPITGETVKRTASNFVGGFLGLVPGGTVLFDKLEEAGAVEDMITWLSNEIKQLGITWSYLKGLVGDIWDEVSITYSWETNFGIAKKHLADPYNRVVRFVKNIINKVKEIIFIGVLKLIGAPVETVLEIIKKGKGVLVKLFTSPISFIKNLFKGLKKGLDGFILRIRKHVLNGLTGWLFGAMASEGIQMPQQFNLKGVFSLILQILGVTYQQIRQKIVKKLGNKGEIIMSGLEGAFQFSQILLRDGPIALWETIKGSLTDLKQMAMEGIREYLVKTVVKEGILWILGIINPAGALVKIVKTLVNVILFFSERFHQILDFANSVFKAITQIADGDVKKAAKAIEDAIARSLPIMIGFLANLLGLGGLAKAVVKILKKIGKKIQAIILKVIAWVVKQGKKLFKGAKKMGRRGKRLFGKIVDWASMKQGFKTPDKKKHKIYIEKEKGGAKFIVASTPTNLLTILDEVVKPRSLSDYKAAKEQYDNLNTITADFESISKKYKLDKYFYTDTSGKIRTQRNSNKGLTEAQIEELDKAKKKISGITKKYYNSLLILSDIIKKYNLEDRGPVTVLSKLEFFQKNGLPSGVKAAPLTALAGNVIGAPADKAIAEVPGKEYLRIMKEIYGKSTKGYPRVHIIHDRLHGPADNRNLAYSSNFLNRSFVNMEHDVIRKVYKSGVIMRFEVTNITYDQKFKWFAREFQAEWEYLQVKEYDKTNPQLQPDNSKPKGKGVYHEKNPNHPPQLSQEEQKLPHLGGSQVVAFATLLNLTPPASFAERFDLLRKVSGPGATITRKRIDGKSITYNFRGLPLPTLMNQYYSYRTQHQPFLGADTTFIQQLQTEAANRNIPINFQAKR